jgi:hypothetical protein
VKDLVAVTWNDAHGSSTTAYAEHEIPHAAIAITTYGLLLREDTAGVTIASEHCADNTYRGVTFIPRGMLVGEPRRITETKPRAKRKKADTPVVPAPSVDYVTP